MKSNSELFLETFVLMFIELSLFLLLFNTLDFLAKS